MTTATKIVDHRHRLLKDPSEGEDSSEIGSCDFMVVECGGCDGLDVALTDTAEVFEPAVMSL